MRHLKMVCSGSDFQFTDSEFFIKIQILLRVRNEHKNRNNWEMEIFMIFLRQAAADTSVVVCIKMIILWKFILNVYKKDHPQLLSFSSNIVDWKWTFININRDHGSQKQEQMIKISIVCRFEERSSNRKVVRASQVQFKVQILKDILFCFSFSWQHSCASAPYHRPSQSSFKGEK